MVDHDVSVGDVQLPGRSEMIRVPRERLSSLSLRGLPDDAFERAARLASERGISREGA